MGRGGPSRIRSIGRVALAVEIGVAALVLSSCGDSDRAGGGRAPDRLSEPDAGDERPPLIEVRLRITDERLVVTPRRVTAFLPLQFTLDNSGSRRAALVRIPGQQRVRVGPRVTAAERSPGKRPGRLRIRAGHGRTAVLRVIAGG